MPLDPCYLDLLTALSPWVFWDELKKERFSALYDLLLDTNQRMNVTALTDPASVTVKHFADSLSLLSIPALGDALRNGSVCDLGCGGGFPGLPLAIAFPEAKLTMIDSTEKKIRAVAENAANLDVCGGQAISGRGEDLSKPGFPLREAFEAVVSRAVAPLPLLIELCLPFVKPCGVFIAMKGAHGREEMEESRRGAGQLGAGRIETISVSFPDADLSRIPDDCRAIVADALNANRELIVFFKTKATPKRFPRTWAQMKKKTL